MDKTEALKLLGGTTALAAKACGITSSAISQWPEVLNKDQTDRVQAALYRLQKPARRNKAKAEA
jgi:hypothetical protein